MKTNGPGQSALLLLDVISILDKLNISYAIIGAMAASFHGAVRASVDADALIAFGEDCEGLEKLLDKLTRIGLVVSQKKGDISDPIAGVISAQDSHNNRVDLLMGIRGMNADVFQRAVGSRFFDVQIQMVGLEDFITMKVFAGEGKDIEDVKNTLSISGETINLPLFRRLALNYGKNTLETLEIILKESGSKKY